MSGSDQISGRQISAGRTLAGLGQEELANLARISVPTLRRMEASDGAAAGLPNNVAAVRAVLETLGIIFIAENGHGPGVRLRKMEFAVEEVSAARLRVRHVQWGHRYAFAIESRKLVERVVMIDGSGQHPAVDLRNDARRFAEEISRSLRLID